MSTEPEAEPSTHAPPLPMAERLRFTLHATDGGARAGTIETPRGVIPTPIFMPVGTQGTVKSLDPDDLRAIDAPIILGNTYHLYLRPGVETLRHFGGLHRMMDWQRPILTDSGGFQFYSLKDLVKFTDAGVQFRSHHDGSKHTFTPASCMAVQDAIGSDIQMVLDECVALPADRKALERAVRRSTTWAVECLDAAQRGRGAVFAIVQGGTELDLRRDHAQALAEHPFGGLALGGLAVGEAPAQMYDVIESTTPSMPADRPRYLMGVGRPIDLVEAIARGVDMFDCVMPTRNARNAQIFTRGGRLNLRNARFARDSAPLDAGCACTTCRRFSRGYVHHLFRAQEMLAARLATIHNLAYYLDLVRGARAAILAGRFAAWRHDTLAAWESGDGR